MTDTPPVVAAKASRPWINFPATRDVLAILSTLLFVAAYFVPMFVKLPQGAPPHDQMEGAMIAQWMLVMGWYFGSSRGSAAKDDTIAAMAAKAPDAGGGQ